MGYEKGKPVLTNADLSLAGPGLFHLQGPNGSGKSTFVELASGYLRPSKGVVEVFGSQANSPVARDHRRVCRAEPALFPSMTVHDHIVLACIARDADKSVALARAERLGVGPWLNENAGNLSTGNRRKLWYVMSTVGAFDLAILDEPFNGLDEDGLREVSDEILSWSDKAAVVLIAHSLPGVLARAAPVFMTDLNTSVSVQRSGSHSGTDRA
ncbi:ATP-binding cassette domain-containing protein [Arthrobacter livingstonensis]|uniref:ATP-binding cassette domain-containing protein n=1 Tax=Arthrobacter livingstonensis TaxID=670078 RepID=UPI001473511B|nr:ATP-binding cassette domain-containing protein [Arthrobacter livingstonensis]